MKRHFSPNRRGFTLVELLVVIAIIGVLMGLVMPAAIRARTTAQTVKCTNNQRNIATAIATFETSKGHYPYLSRGGASWCVQILEQLGLGKLAAAHENGNLTTDNATAQAEFKCPLGDAPAKGTNYVVNAGCLFSDSDTNKPNPTNAVRGSALFFYYHGKGKSYKSTLGAIKDGASNTILLSERLGVNSKVSGWVAPADNWVANYSSQANSQQRLGLMWTSGQKTSTTPAASTPNFSPVSKHSNINVIGFADGSVRSVNKLIWGKTYVSLMCPIDDYVDTNLSYASDPNYK